METDKSFEPKMDAEDHYLRIDKGILNLNKNALSKKTLLEYILHCRRLNPTKNQSCSMSGASSAKKDLGLNKEAHEKALKELKAKHLISMRPGVGTGFLKTIAVEVMAFPNYDKKTNKFSLDDAKPHNHRTYDKSKNQYINIPSIIVDKGYLKELNIQNIFALLWLYSKTDLTDYRGVNFNFIHCFNNENKSGYEYHKTFGDGFMKSIFGKSCVEANFPNKYKLPDIEFQGCLVTSINELLGKGFFELIPILLWQDPEDKDIAKIEGEIFKGIVLFKDSEDLYLFLEPEENIKAIWILRPHFLVKNTGYEIFEQIRKANYEYEYNRYHFNDIGTDREAKKECIKEEYFEDYLCEWKPDFYEKVDHLLRNPNEDNIEEIIDILPDYVFRVYETKYKVNVGL